MLIRLAVAFFCAIISFSSLAQTASQSPKKTGAQSTKKVSPQVLFKTGSATVTVDEFNYLYRKNHQDKPEEYTRAKIDEYLNLFIDFKLKVQEAKRRGMDTTAAFRKEYNSYRA